MTLRACLGGTSNLPTTVVQDLDRFFDVMPGGSPFESVVGVGRLAPLLVELGGEADQDVDESGAEILRPEVDPRVE